MCGGDYKNIDECVRVRVVGCTLAQNIYATKDTTKTGKHVEKDNCACCDDNFENHKKIV